jgi:hypothetical protein
LFVLYQLFRRSSPKPKVAGAYARLLVVPDNDRAEEMARRFYQGDQEYQADVKWWELVEEADRALLLGRGPATPAAPTQPGDEDDFFGSAAGSGASSHTLTDGAAATGTNGLGAPRASRQAATPRRLAIPSLTREYVDDESGLRFDVKAYDIEYGDPSLDGLSDAWSFSKTPLGPYEFLVRTDHPVFSSATMTPLDALLAQLAWTASDFSRGGPQRQLSFERVLTGLRRKYATVNNLDPIELTRAADETLREVARVIGAEWEPAERQSIYDELDPQEQEAIVRAMARRMIPNHQRAIDAGRFLEFAPLPTLLSVFQRHPEPDVGRKGRPHQSVHPPPAPAPDQGVAELVQ